jgi:hypothetical protein
MGTVNCGIIGQLIQFLCPIYLTQKASAGMYSGCDYPHKSCLHTFWPCHPYFILQFYCFFYPTYKYYGFIYKHMKKLQSAITLILRRESKFLKVKFHSACLCKNYVPKCSQIPHELYIVITIVERDTRKYHEFIAKYCYECEARVTIRQ